MYRHCRMAELRRTAVEICASAMMVVPRWSIDSILTFDLRLRHGMQALDIHRRLGAGSPFARIESRVGGEGESGSALGRMGRGGCLGFMVIRLAKS
jgi:hypothetical protein